MWLFKTTTFFKNDLKKEKELDVSLMDSDHVIQGDWQESFFCKSKNSEKKKNKLLLFLLIIT